MSTLSSDIERDDKPLVLIIDSDAATVRHVTHVLQPAGFRTMYAEDSASGMCIAEKYEPHLILLDLKPPQPDGFEACRQMKDRIRLADTPVVFITEMKKSDALVQQSFEVGGHDLLFKPLSDVELVARIRVALREQNLRESYRRLAVEDPYTGLANRRHFIVCITEAILSAQRIGEESILVIADIDNLMAYNDRYGHDLGDEAILTLARLFKRFQSPTCRVGRLGGEELAMVLSRSSRQAAWALCDRLRQTFAAIAFDAITSPKHFTACFGLASYAGDPAEFDVDQFLLQSDIALCAAKEHGRSRMASYWQLDPNCLPILSPKKRHARAKSRKRCQRAYVAALTAPATDAPPPPSPKK
jgi:diguanylate cyclase (GGDEF)-like protein